jgi:hypothetical protein
MIVFASLLVLCAAAMAQTEQRPLIALIADGQARFVTMADGSDARLTLSPDGRGRLESFGESFPTLWREGGPGQFCIKLTPALPEQCMGLNREGQSVVGRKPDGRVAIRIATP